MSAYADYLEDYNAENHREFLRRHPFTPIVNKTNQEKTMPDPTDPTPRTLPGSRPPPNKQPRPHVDCGKVQHTADILTVQGHPEIAQFILRVTGCA